jgi:hypothetical protein
MYRTLYVQILMWIELAFGASLDGRGTFRILQIVQEISKPLSPIFSPFGSHPNGLMECKLSYKVAFHE